MVAVLDKRKKPMDPCTERRAKILLTSKRARIHSIFPVFTIRIVDRCVEDSVVHPLRIGIDPGSKTTGVALSRQTENGERTVALFELEHRGQQIHAAMTARRQLRHGRRFRKTRYRAPRFLNRTRSPGWLPPSVKHRVDSVLNFVRKLRKLYPLDLKDTSLNVETAKFDTQKMVKPEISGVEYQQGTLQGYEIRAYILQKFKYTCAYCGKSINDKNGKNVKLTIDHVIPKSKGGTDKVSNLVLACKKCNDRKGNKPLEKFCPEKVDEIKKALGKTLDMRDAAAINATRYRIVDGLKEIGFSHITTSVGSQTEVNRLAYGVPKAHCLDALFSGETRPVSGWEKMPIMAVRCNGRGLYQRANVDKNGHCTGHKTRKKVSYGFITGDMISADVKEGTKIGKYFGRVAIRATGSFAIYTENGKVDGISHKWCKLIQRGDGYSYFQKPGLVSLNSSPTCRGGGLLEEKR